ncbi:peptidylprolyl isomerase fpr3 [Dipsacomyces acuminosporus]|nr:peptidylprolyl isomerase fpr3 [Dipsacomyces acuminosporus]
MKRTSVILTVDDKSFVLCSLTPGKIEQQALDLSLTEGEEITFETQGSNEVHLTGNFIDDEEPYGSEDESDDENDIDFSQLSPEELEEMIQEGLIDPSILEEDDDDADYDSDDAEADDRIREIADEEEEDLEDELEEEDIPEPEPVKEVKIKKQAEKKDNKKRKAEAEAPAEEAPAKAKKEKKEKKKEEKKPKTIQLPGGIVVEDKKEGTGPEAKKGKRVAMHYIGKLTNGKVFDQNTKGKPFWFRLGAGEVIKGWDLGIAGMKKGGERRLTIPGPMAYGKRGAPPDIPPNATLVFDVRLIDFK